MTPLFGPGRAHTAGFALVTVTFLVGGLAGAAPDRVVMSDAIACPAAEEETRRGHVIDQIDMTPDQRARIDSILERRSERMKAAWAGISPRLGAITDSARYEIMEVLTPEQRTEYERRLEERRQQREAERAEEEAR